VPKYLDDAASGARRRRTCWSQTGRGRDRIRVLELGAATVGDLVSEAEKLSGQWSDPDSAAESTDHERNK